MMHRGDFPPPHGPFRDDMLRDHSDHSDTMDPKRQRALRSVFIANISFDTTEEQLSAVLSEIGPVSSIKIVNDPATGRPRGFGFGEYEDVETAMSAIRNLQGRVVNGRSLKLDSAINSPDEKFRPRPPVGPPIPAREPSPYGAPVPPQAAPEAITKAVASLPPEQMFELMRQMKHSVKTNPSESRQLLLHNPQLAYAILQALVIMRVVDPEAAMKILHQAPRGTPLPTAPPQEQQPPQRGPPQDPHLPLRGPPQEPHLSQRGPPQEPHPSQRGPPQESHPPHRGPPFQEPPLRGPPDSHRGPHHEPHPPMRGPPPFSGPPHHDMHRGPPPFGRDEPPRNRGPPFDPRDGPRDSPGRGDHFMPPGRDMPPPRRDLPPPHGPPGQNRGPPPPHFMESSRHGPPGGRDHAFNHPGPRSMGGGPPMSSANSPPRQAPPSSAPPPQRSSSSGGQQSSSSGSGGGGKVDPRDQEKAALIMQVLSLTDEQISMLPTEQKKSILQLKEQITRGATSK